MKMYKFEIGTFGEIDCLGIDLNGEFRMKGYIDYDENVNMVKKYESYEVSYTGRLRNN